MAILWLTVETVAERSGVALTKVQALVTKREIEQDRLLDDHCETPEQTKAYEQARELVATITKDERRTLNQALWTKADITIPEPGDLN